MTHHLRYESFPPVEKDRYSHRESVLDSAKDAVMRARNASYGDPHQDFARSAKIVTVLLGDKLQPGVEVSAAEIAKIMIAVKLSRLTWTPDHTDSWTDIAGYAACGYEASKLAP